MRQAKQSAVTISGPAVPMRASRRATRRHSRTFPMTSMAQGGPGTMTTYSDFLDARMTASGGVLEALKDAFRSWRRAHSERRTLGMLSDLDDHLLTDIGLNPREVRSSLAGWMIEEGSSAAGPRFLGRL